MQYQNISDDKENFLDTWIYHKCFEEQLDYISKNNISIIPLEDTVAYINGDLRLKKQSFLSPLIQDILNSIPYVTHC